MLDPLLETGEYFLTPDALPASRTTKCDAIVRKGRIRGESLRHGRVLRKLAEGTTNLEATLAYTRGVLQEEECTHCAKGSGPFTSCVVMPGFFKGACTNCHYNDNASRCTLHFQHG
jgi:hypothetical protein